MAAVLLFSTTRDSRQTAIGYIFTLKGPSNMVKAAIYLFDRRVSLIELQGSLAVERKVVSVCHNVLLFLHLVVRGRKREVFRQQRRTKFGLSEVKCGLTENVNCFL